MRSCQRNAADVMADLLAVDRHEKMVVDFYQTDFVPCLVVDPRVRLGHDLDVGVK